jgi:hypothetical protein
MLLLLLPSSTAVLTPQAIMQQLLQSVCAAVHCNCFGFGLAVLLKWQGA